MSWGARKTGFQQLDGKMAGMKRLSGDDVAIRALTAAGQPIAEAARANVRVASGRLRDSIIVGTQLSPSQAAAATDDGKPHVYVGPGSLVEAITEEFGTVHEGPHPFLRPAWEAGQGGALDAAQAAYEAEFDQVAGG